MGNKRKVKKLNVNGNKRESERKERKKGSQEEGGKRKRRVFYAIFLGHWSIISLPRGSPPQIQGKSSSYIQYLI